VYTGYRDGDSPPEWLQNIGVGFDGPPFGGEQPEVDRGAVDMPTEEIKRVITGTCMRIEEEESAVQDLRHRMWNRYFEDEETEVPK